MKGFKKLKWVFIIGAVFTLGVTTNVIDERNYNKINQSIVSIYEDRLLVKHTILDMATVINQKEVAFLTRDTIFIKASNPALTEKLKSDLMTFSRTKVTSKQNEYLTRLQENLELMFRRENELLKNQFTTIDQYKIIIARVNENMDVLAHIQMNEGKREFMQSQRDLVSIGIFSWLEIIAMTLFAVISLVLIYREPK